MDQIHVTKIRCLNFRAFPDRLIDNLTPGTNVLIGDNETGKSSLLFALDLTLRASVSRVQTFGLERLFNREAVAGFLSKADRSFADLPKLQVDIHLGGITDHQFEGRYHSGDTGDNADFDAFGICLICSPNPDLKDAIDEVILGDDASFPFEYYLIEFKTFSGASLHPQKQPVDHVTIDNTQISNDYASRAYVRDMYRANTEDSEQSRHQIKYREAKNQFAAAQLEDLNKKLGTDTKFAVKSNSRANLTTDLTIKQKDIDIEDLGMGMQCFIRTTFALSKKTNIDVVLLEEPENHLSQSNMKRLIDEISSVTKSQVFVATHSSYICSRLNLKNAIFFGSPSEPPIRLSDISDETANFFIKAPNNSLLEFIQAERSILVEGDAEFMLLNPFFKNITDGDLDSSPVVLISVGGLSFPRYMEVAALLKNRVAVITDNDGDLESSRLATYREFAKADNIAVFHDPDKDRSTFEICVYRDNTAICDALFGEGRKTLTVEEYMLKNKTEAAFQLASRDTENLTPPAYVKEGIEWISD